MVPPVDPGGLCEALYITLGRSRIRPEAELIFIEVPSHVFGAEAELGGAFPLLVHSPAALEGWKSSYFVGWLHPGMSQDLPGLKRFPPPVSEITENF